MDDACDQWHPHQNTNFFSVHAGEEVEIPFQKQTLLTRNIPDNVTN